MPKLYQLLDENGKAYQSERKGTLGGYKPSKLYGRLDCPSALRHLAKGHYAKHRVFFADEATAIKAGYRPCSRCMPEEYRKWQTEQATNSAKKS